MVEFFEFDMFIKALGFNDMPLLGRSSFRFILMGKLLVGWIMCLFDG